MLNVRVKPLTRSYGHQTFHVCYLANTKAPANKAISKTKAKPTHDSQGSKIVLGLEQSKADKDVDQGVSAGGSFGTSKETKGKALKGKSHRRLRSVYLY